MLDRISHSPFMLAVIGTVAGTADVLFNSLFPLNTLFRTPVCSPLGENVYTPCGPQYEWTWLPKVPDQADVLLGVAVGLAVYFILVSVILSIRAIRARS